VKRRDEELTVKDKVHYKVSLVVEKRQYPGAIVSLDRPPQVGDEIALDGRLFLITEVSELMNARDDFGFVHATCRYLRPVV
jgi:hypothetical protein